MSREAQIKAAYLFNFGSYVEWPAEAFAEETSPLVLGVLGNSTIARYLPYYEGRKSQGRPVKVQVFARVEDIDTCHILYIAPSVSEAGRSQALQHLAGRPILTVGDDSAFLAAGGMIGFIVTDNKVRGRTNLQAARDAALRINSKLLSIFTPVK